MKHTAKRRACALRLSPIGITSFCKEVANRLFVSQRPCPSGARVFYHKIACAVNFYVEMTQNRRFAALTKHRENAKIKPVRTAAIAVAVVPKEILNL